MKDIPYLNLHLNEFKNPNMCAHKGDEKLQELAPTMGNSVKQDEMQEVFHNEITINFVLTQDCMNRATTNIDLFGGPPRP